MVYVNEYTIARGEEYGSLSYKASIPLLTKFVFRTANYFGMSVKSAHDKQVILENDTVSRRCNIEGSEEDITRFAAMYRLYVEYDGFSLPYTDTDLEKLNARLAGTQFERMHLHNLFPRYNKYDYYIFPLIVCHVMGIKTEEELCFVKDYFRKALNFEKYAATIDDLIAAFELREECPETTLRELLA